MPSDRPQQEPPALTAEQLDELERLERQATEGPWCAWHPRYTAADGWVGKAAVHGLPITDADRSPVFWERDAAFIAAARNALPALLAMARRAAAAEGTAPAAGSKPFVVVRNQPQIRDALSDLWTSIVAELDMDCVSHQLGTSVNNAEKVLNETRDPDAPLPPRTDAAPTATAGAKAPHAPIQLEYGPEQALRDAAAEEASGCGGVFSVGGLAVGLDKAGQDWRCTGCGEWMPSHTKTCVRCGSERLGGQTALKELADEMDRAAAFPAPEPPAPADGFYGSAEAKRWALALQSLTPGGSEYVGDPDRCVAAVRDRQDGLHRQVLRLAKATAAANARVEALEKENAGLRDTMLAARHLLRPMRGYFCSAECMGRCKDCQTITRFDAALAGSPQRPQPGHVKGCLAGSRSPEPCTCEEIAGITGAPASATTGGGDATEVRAQDVCENDTMSL